MPVLTQILQGLKTTYENKLQHFTLEHNFLKVVVNRDSNLSLYTVPHNLVLAQNTIFVFKQKKNR